MVKKLRRHPADFQFRITLEAPEGNKTMRELSSEHGIHANVIRSWKRQLPETRFTCRPLVRAADRLPKSPNWLICGYCRRRGQFLVVGF